jgi:hypothetical protein
MFMADTGVAAQSYDSGHTHAMQFSAARDFFKRSAVFNQHVRETTDEIDNSLFMPLGDSKSELRYQLRFSG